MNGRLIASLISFFILLNVVFVFVGELIFIMFNLVVMSASIYLKGIKKSRLFHLYNLVVFAFFIAFSVILGDSSGETSIGILFLPFFAIGYVLIFSILPPFIYKTVYNSKSIQNWMIVISILLSILISLSIFYQINIF